MENFYQELSDCITSTRKHIIFVYGTLRNGFGNHYLLESSTFIGVAKTKEKYALYARGIPFLSRTKAVSTVLGEVYAVDETTLGRLDQLEGHPTWYRREKAVVVLHDGTEVVAWIYFCDQPEGELIESGDYLQKDSPRRSHHSV
jgi:gamma-glutamylaminecyclotransferase